MASVYGESTGREFVLGQEIAIGGGGTVYAVVGKEVACKLHDPSKVNPDEALARIRHLAKNPIGWPTLDNLEVVADTPGGPAIGFVMRRVKNANELAAYFDEHTRFIAGIRITHAQLVRLASRLSSGLQVLHDKGVVFADLHCKQILIDRGHECHFLEPDGYEIGLRMGGVYRWLRSGVGMYEYAPPEHQGIPFSDLDRTIYSDRWALAILVWRLIKGGAFPHQVSGTSVTPLYPTDLVKLCAFPHDAQANLPSGYLPVDDPPEFMNLPSPIRQLFIDCFVAGARDPKQRPAASVWASALSDYANLAAGRLHGNLPGFPSVNLRQVKIGIGLAASAAIVGGSFYLGHEDLPAASSADPVARSVTASEKAIIPPPPVRMPTPFKNPPDLWDGGNP